MRSRGFLKRSVQALHTVQDFGRRAVEPLDRGTQPTINSLTDQLSIVSRVGLFLCGKRGLPRLCRNLAEPV